MKRFALYLATAATVVASCSSREENIDSLLKTDEIFYASFEQPKEDGTKVYANEDLLLRWTADDRVSIFNKITYNQEYKFTGQTGANSGGFKKVESDEFVTGNATSHVVSVYPYQESTEISESEELTVTLPAEQHYAEDTFGLGANTMVSVSSDNVLQYKNVGGYLKISLFGAGISVSSITLKGNNGEKLAGIASITMPLDGVPSVTMASDASNTITLTCDSPIQLGATAEKSTQFWFVVPPVTFSKGFTLSILHTLGSSEIRTSKMITIERSTLSQMSPVEITPTQPTNVIYYTSSDDNVIVPNDATSTFGANIVSNEYINGVGILSFDGEVTSIGDQAFWYSNLSSIRIPKGVKSIGARAFESCSELHDFVLPNGITSIGWGAFQGCKKLSSIIIPDSVTSIGDIAFHGCTGLTSISISNSVTRLNCFSSCIGLTSVSIPNSVTSLGGFASCRSLTSITIPDSVTTIESCAFEACTSLTEITIPKSVTSIGSCAFYKCVNLASVIIPEGVTNIGERAFRTCTNLTYIIVMSTTPPTGGDSMFANTNNTIIYVPDESVSTYKNAEFWIDYADRIQAISSISVPVP